MKEQYSGNKIFITEKEQERIKNYPILLCLHDTNSTIAECALQLGFENLTIALIQGVSNTFSSKIEFKNRLKSINEKVKLEIYKLPLDKEKIRDTIHSNRIAVNQLFLSSDLNLLVDSICKELNIPVIHPYNLGWSGLVTIINPSGTALKSIAKPNTDFNELVIAEYASSYFKYWGNKQNWLDDIIERYKNEADNLNFTPPGLSIASWILGGICCHLLFNIATNKSYKTFPEFYLTTVFNS